MCSRAEFGCGLSPFFYFFFLCRFYLTPTLFLCALGHPSYVSIQMGLVDKKKKGKLPRNLKVLPFQKDLLFFLFQVRFAKQFAPRCLFFFFGSRASQHSFNTYRKNGLHLKREELFFFFFLSHPLTFSL